MNIPPWQRVEIPRAAGERVPEVRLATPAPATGAADIVASLVESITGIHPGPIELERDAFGRPRLVLPAGIKAPDISLSHPPEAMAVAMHGGGRVGVDVESLSIQPTPELLTDLLTPAERQSLGSTPSSETIVRRFAAKEALLKAIGQGIGFGFQNVELEPIDGTLLRVTRLRGSSQLAAGWRVWTQPLTSPTGPLILAVAWSQ